MVELLQIKPSSLLVYEIGAEGQVMLTAKSATFEELADSFPAKRRKKPATDEQIQATIRAGAARRFKKANG